MPFNSTILDVQIQNDYPMLWVMVDSSTEERKRVIFTCSTGEDVPFDVLKLNINKYIGTYQNSKGFVGHVFDGGEE